MSPLDLLTPEAGLAVTAVTGTPDLIAIAAATNAPTANCPRCDRPSDRVHSRYTCTAADLPWEGRRVILRVTVRRFRCRTAGCECAIFCERLPAILTPHVGVLEVRAGGHKPFTRERAQVERCLSQAERRLMQAVKVLAFLRQVPAGAIVGQLPVAAPRAALLSSGEN